MTTAPSEARTILASTFAANRAVAERIYGCVDAALPAVHDTFHTGGDYGGCYRRVIGNARRWRNEPGLPAGGLNTGDGA